MTAMVIAWTIALCTSNLSAGKAGMLQKRPIAAAKGPPVPYAPFSET